MKKLSVCAAMVSLVLVFAVSSGLAQQPSQEQPQAQQQTPSAPSPATPKADVDVRTDPSPSTPAPGRGPDVNVNVERRDSETRVERETGESALPRAATGERTVIFGLSPTWALIIGVALLMVVILAIVSMSRSDSVYIDRDHRH